MVMITNSYHPEQCLLPGLVHYKKSHVSNVLVIQVSLVLICIWDVMHVVFTHLCTHSTKLMLLRMQIHFHALEMLCYHNLHRFIYSTPHNFVPETYLKLL